MTVSWASALAGRVGGCLLNRYGAAGQVRIDIYGDPYDYSMKRSSEIVSRRRGINCGRSPPAPRQASRMADTTVQPVGAGSGIPSTSPEADHTWPRGQAWQPQPAVGRGVASRGTVWSACRRDATQPQHARSLITAEGLVEKHLTRIRCLAAGTLPSEPTTPIYINWYINEYGRHGHTRT